MKAYEYFAKILRAKPETVKTMEEKMNAATNKQGILDKLMQENEHRINRTLNILNCHDYDAEIVFRALVTRLQKDDRALYELFKKPKGTSTEDLKTLFNFALESANIGPLFVLKKEVAQEILIQNPPSNIMQALNYKDVNEMLANEDLFEIFSALRFVESKEWMRQTFENSYKDLTINDFEEREVSLIVLSEKWLKVAEKFLQKKYHNVSHLKELGVVFIIPLEIDTPGETIRVFSMVLHYLHETDFYSKMFKKMINQENFGEKMISLLRGDAPEKIQPDDKKINWPIIQTYLAKDDINDPRLFIPHLNPEALHWLKTERDLSYLGKRFESIDLEMWLELDWVGGFFKKKKGKEELISFDMIDNWMALTHQEEKIKYLYHHQEALWNKIFSEYMGDENLEKLMVENFGKGFVQL